MISSEPTRGSINGQAPTSTVGRGKSIVLEGPPDVAEWQDPLVHVALGNTLSHYKSWPTPKAIVSDGGYGVLGFEGDTSDHLGLPDWYEPHVREWSKYATAATTLWFWNSEIGWAAVHPVLERLGWRYVACNIWNKGKGHIAGNVNTKKIRRFPVVTELCAHYVFGGRIGGRPLKVWLLQEWKRTGLAVKRANDACGVKDAAVRKYLDQGHLWYYPPPEMFERMVAYANEHGRPDGRPYYSIDGVHPATADEWRGMRSTFNCPHGVTNVWDRNALHGGERISTPEGKAVHLNQKPLDLMSNIIEASTDPGDVVWEPFGGLFTGTVAARRLGRRARSCEIDPTYFQFGVTRLRDDRQPVLPRPKIGAGMGHVVGCAAATHEGDEAMKATPVTLRSWPEVRAEIETRLGNATPGPFDVSACREPTPVNKETP